MTLLATSWSMISQSAMASGDAYSWSSTLLLLVPDTQYLNYWAAIFLQSMLKTF